MSDLVVTKNGVPLADQAEGIRQFKEACRQKPASDLVERLRKRAKEDKACADNNKAVVDALSEQMRLFESRKGHNVYAVRMAVDHKSNMARDIRYAADLEQAADRIEELERQVREARKATEKMHRRAQHAEGVHLSLLFILNGWNKVYEHRKRNTSDWITREVLREMTAKVEKADRKLVEGGEG